MEKARKTISVILCIFLALSLSIFVITQNLFQAIKSPEKIESSLTNSGIYSSIVSDEINLHKNEVIVGNIYISTPWVKQDIQKTFTSSLVQNDTNKVINGVFPWIAGKSTTPSFNINLSPQQQEIESDVFSYVQDKLDQLPNCSIGYLLSHLRENPNPFTLTCIPSFVSQNLLSSQVKEQLDSVSLFSTNLNDNNLKLNNSQTIDQQFSYLPAGYKDLNTVRYLSVATSIVLALVLAYRAKKSGLRLISISVFTSGVICLLATSNDLRLEKLITLKINNSLGSSQVFWPYVRSTVDSFIGSTSSTLRVTSICMIVVGLLSWLLFKFILKEKPSKIIVVTNPR